MKKNVFLEVVGLLLLLSSGGSYSSNSVPAHTEGQKIAFHVYSLADSGAVRRIKWGVFRRIQENEKRGRGDNDMLLNPQNLSVIQGYPLQSSNGRSDGDPMIVWPSDNTSPKISLSLAWPTPDGYSNLILDLPNPTTHSEFYKHSSSEPNYIVFNLLAAGQVLTDLEAAMSYHAHTLPYTPSADFQRLRETAITKLNAAKAATDETQQGKLAQESLEAAARATLIMLQDYGIQYAREQRSKPHPENLLPAWGVTFDVVSESGNNERELETVRQLVHCYPNDGWVRVVFSKGVEPRRYKPILKAAHAKGLRIVGQLLDSFDMCSTTRAEWEARVKEYVDALSETVPSGEYVDEWEVGNEVNGRWLVVKPDERCGGLAGTADYINYAADYIKNKAGYLEREPAKRTMLTLFWQLGEDDPQYSMFTWVKKQLSADVMKNIDDVGISLYPDKNPLGLSFHRVFTTLKSEHLLSHQRAMITELGYWPREAEPDYEHLWWWKYPSDRDRKQATTDVAKLYQSAALGYPFSGGGSFWWYYLQEAVPDHLNNNLWKTLSSVHSDVIKINTLCSGTERIRTKRHR